jgi:outer membrane protein OmpA-like peptidoglycan-associated protein
MGTEDTEGLIVDVLVASRAFAADHPDVLELLLRHYFRVLRQLRDDPDALARQAAGYAGLERAQTPVVIAGVRWQGLTDNAFGWFGLGAPAVRAEEGLIDALEGAAEILRDSGVGTGLIPDGDPYRLVASRFVESLYEGSQSPSETTDGARRSGAVAHAPLSEGQWARLREVGTLKVRPILFQSGTASLALRGKEQLDAAAKSLAHYPRFRLRIKGHTGTRGDPVQNRLLSAERAEAVARYLAVTHGVAWARMQPSGRGAEEPLARRPGESERAYQDRLRRVELVLVAGED